MYIPLLSKIDPELITICDNSIKHAKELIEKWLSNGMLKIIVGVVFISRKLMELIFLLPKDWFSHRDLKLKNVNKRARQLQLTYAI